MSHDGHTISCCSIGRETPGFGCPHCGAPLPRDQEVLRLAAVRGLRCCGYFPRDGEAVRWLHAADALDAVSA